MKIFGFEEYGGPEVLAFTEVPTPEPGPGQVLIHMQCAGVNPADVKVRSGDRQGAVPVEFPMAVGREATGNVVAVGDGVDAGLIDRDVFGATASGTGALAEYVLLDAAATAVRPDRLPRPVAASIPVSVGTAVDAMDALDLDAGDTLVVIGAGGGVGSSAVQIARSRGIRVIGVASESKRALLESYDVEWVPSGYGWVSSAREIAGGPVDAILDLVGGSVLYEAVALLPQDANRAGKLISLADTPAARELGGAGVERRRTTTQFDRVAQLVLDGVVRPVVPHWFGFDEAADAVALVESGHAEGNVVVMTGSVAGADYVPAQTSAD